MAQPSEMLTQLLDMSHQGPLLGEGVAFGPLDEPRREIIHAQVYEVAAMTAANVTLTLRAALPEASSDDIAAHVRQIIPKATAFMPALTAGELRGEDDTRLLSFAASAVSYMYAADQLIDRGDSAMEYAVDAYNGKLHAPPRVPAADIATRMKIMTGMQEDIIELGGADAPDIEICYSGLVLHNEVRLQRIGRQYHKCKTPEAAKTYLDMLAITTAELMVADAGYQSVTASLHPLYKRHNSDLPSINTLHSDSRVQHLMQIANAAARVGDERSDWWMDAGNDPRYGVPTLNPFIQPHPKLTATLCRLAGITDPLEVKMMHDGFVGFANANDARERSEHGAAVTDHFFNQLRMGIAEAEDAWPPEFKQYLTLIKRVGEICIVNMELGDIRMGGGTMPD